MNVSDASTSPVSYPVPPPSEAVHREVEALRAILGLPPEESEPDERAPPEPMQPDKPIPPDHDTPNQP